MRDDFVTPRVAWNIVRTLGSTAAFRLPDLGAPRTATNPTNGADVRPKSTPARLRPSHPPSVPGRHVARAPSGRMVSGRARRRPTSFGRAYAQLARALDLALDQQLNVIWRARGLDRDGRESRAGVALFE